MYCEKCKQRPATVHLTQIVNNEKTEMHLCDVCAKEYHQFPMGWGEGFSVPKFLAGLLNYDPGVGDEIQIPYRQPMRCEKCGLTYNQFRQIGKFGCSDCYIYFADRLEPLLKRVHGTSKHTGKVPHRTGGTIKLRKELNQLKEDLQRLIIREEFEEAAKVRDRIRDLEKKLGE